ncbi:hypothetical protein VE02_00785 [Pseudogymnoascus sp. 03VT05]|nr:hypothetical protein VE02_00785 [Pseudogymnoascus sp. 03VT05]
MALHSLQRHLAFNQNIISGIVLFFTVGIYLAVLGLGAGGGKPSSQRVSDISNCALYAIFAVFGFFTGSIMNKMGPKLTMLIGIFGYPFYIAGLFYYDRTGGEGFPIAGGIVLGLSAPMLWSVSGFIQWAYATEVEKGQFISWQYFINQVGSVIGSLVAFVIILNGTSTADGSPTGVYIAFLILMCMAFLVAYFGLVKPADVRRADGTPIAVFHALSFKQELAGVSVVLKDVRVLALLPVMFCSEMTLAITPSFNGSLFNLRTRALNPVIFYTMALPSTWMVTYLTDRSATDRKRRGIYAVSFVGFLLIVGWVPLYVWTTLSPTYANPPVGGVDWTDSSRFAGPFIIYLIFGVLYTCHQLVGMWVFGTFSNDPRVLAVYGGLWKGVAGGGLAVIFGIASSGIKFHTQLIIVMSLQFISLPLMLFLVIKYCTNTNYGKEENVVVPHYAEKQFHVYGASAKEDNGASDGQETPKDADMVVHIEKNDTTV